MAGRRFGQLMAGLNEVCNPALEAKYNSKTKKVSGVISESLLAKGFVFAALIGSTVGAHKLVSNGPVIRKLKKEIRELNEQNEALLGDISRCNKVPRLFLKQSAAVAKN